MWGNLFLCQSGGPVKSAPDVPSANIILDKENSAAQERTCMVTA